MKVIAAAILLFIAYAGSGAFAADQFKQLSPASLKAMEADGKELAIVDPREERQFGDAHLLHAVSIPLSKLELNIRRMVPRPATRIVLTDGGEGISERAAATLKQLGYTDLAVLAGGYPAWKKAGYEVFSGTNVAGKAFGEWVVEHYGTPFITPEELHKKVAAGEDLVILDSRPPNEYANMSIPGAINVPGSELVYRFYQLQLKPETLVVVNCAGRTRSQLGAQSLITAGVPNKVVALRGGTMGWFVAGFPLDHDSTKHAPEPWGGNLQKSLDAAQKVASRAGVKVIDAKQLEAFKADKNRSLYVIDVRSVDEYRAGHRPDSAHGWGVQLVQGMDKFAGARHARVVLVDNYMVRALMTASWLVQADWPETYVLKDPFAAGGLATGDYKADVPGLEAIKLPRIEPAELNARLQAKKATVIDVAGSLAYETGHIPGAWFAIRSRLHDSLKVLPESSAFVVTGDDPALVALTARDLAQISRKQVSILNGGNAAWRRAKLPVTSGLENLATKTDDAARHPYRTGREPMTPAFKDAANAYFAWELQLPEQINRAQETNFKLPAAEAHK